MYHLYIFFILADADNVTNVHVANQSLDMVTLAWDEPIEPNGLILTYQIEYKRMDIENVIITIIISMCLYI